MVLKFEHSPSTPLPSPPTSDGQVTTTEITSTTAPPSSGTSGSKGKTFLQNKPLSGFVYGLAGLVVLIILIIAVTSYVRRRKRKRLMTDASGFSFDPKDIEDRTSSAEEKYSHPGPVGYHSSGHGHGEYDLGIGAAGGFTGGGVPRPAPLSPPMSTYYPQDYAGYEGAYPVQYHNLANIALGYGQTPNHYDMYGPRNGGGYPIGQPQYDQFYPPGPSGDHLLVTDHGAPVPRQLQPGVHPVQGQTFAPPSFTNPPLLNRPPILSTVSPPPASLQSTADPHDLPRLPTPDRLPGISGQWKSSDDDAYGGASLGHDASPPGLRTLQVSWAKSTRTTQRY